MQKFSPSGAFLRAWGGHGSGPGQFDHPDYLAALDRVAKAAAETGTIAGFMPTSVDQATDLIARGFTLLAYTGDLWLYQQALASGLTAIRSAAKG